MSIHVYAAGWRPAKTAAVRGSVDCWCPTGLGVPGQPWTAARAPFTAETPWGDWWPPPDPKSYGITVNIQSQNITQYMVEK